MARAIPQRTVSEQCLQMKTPFENKPDSLTVVGARGCRQTYMMISAMRVAASCPPATVLWPRLYFQRQEARTRRQRLQTSCPSRIWKPESELTPHVDFGWRFLWSSAKQFAAATTGSEELQFHDFSPRAKKMYLELNVADASIAPPDG
mmetsp:Transcript_89544/g.141331  ORF Transcript_89544/g.141331 Transcript_89544/m.141331 type:complete len:148 (+) Transcript_89544:62-505(+)